MPRPNQCPAWQQLLALHRGYDHRSLAHICTEESYRFSRYHLHAGGLLLDYSKNYLNEPIFTALLELAQQMQVTERFHAQLCGARVNRSQNRAALHTALREIPTTTRVTDAAIIAQIRAHRRQLGAFAHAFHQQRLQTRNGQSFTDVVHIGIGGSYLGPHMVCNALAAFATGPRCHFIANMDPHEVIAVLEKVHPPRTLFLIASKSFTTEETLINAQAIRHWLKARDLYFDDHWWGISAHPQRVAEYGIPATQCLPIAAEIGGRFSLWSAMGLPLLLSIGTDGFDALLDGARAMDDHATNAPAARNMPLILALLALWYRNFWHTQSRAMLVYSHLLRDLPLYCQQLFMESLGKSVDTDGIPLDYDSGEVLWGGEGTNGQHAYHQLLHQGTTLIPCDFILVGHQHPALSSDYDQHMQQRLLAHGLAQSQAMLIGASADNGHRMVAGNRPSNTLLMEALTPFHLGALIALYEHQVAMQGYLWNINPFDQWGVELGKRLSTPLRTALCAGKTPTDGDVSTRGLIAASAAFCHSR